MPRGPLPPRQLPAHLPPSLRRNRPPPAHLPPPLRRNRPPPAHLPPSLRRNRPPPAHLPPSLRRSGRPCAALQPTPTATTSVGAAATCLIRLQTSAPTSTASPISGMGRGTWRNAKTACTACQACAPVPAPITAVTFAPLTVGRKPNAGLVDSLVAGESVETEVAAAFGCRPTRGSARPGGGGTLRQLVQRPRAAVTAVPGILRRTGS